MSGKYRRPYPAIVSIQFFGEWDIEVNCYVTIARMMQSVESPLILLPAWGFDLMVGAEQMMTPKYNPAVLEVASSRFFSRASAKESLSQRK